MLKHIVDGVGFKALEVLFKSKLSGMIILVLFWVFVLILLHHDLSHFEQLEKLSCNLTRILSVKN